MTIELSEIVKSILSATESLQAEDQLIFQQVVDKANSFIEGIEFLLQEECPELAELFKPVIDEIFIDFHIAVTLAMAKRFKAAYVLLRTCIELSVYLLYFVDHRVEARMWSNNSQDLNFSDILTQVATSKYLTAASGRDINEDEVKTTLKNLQCAYRDLSERVHGKYMFLQSAETEFKSTPTDFKAIVSKSVDALKSLIIFRCRDLDKLESKVPGIGRRI